MGESDSMAKRSSRRESVGYAVSLRTCFTHETSSRGSFDTAAGSRTVGCPSRNVERKEGRHCRLLIDIRHSTWATYCLHLPGAFSLALGLVLLSGCRPSSSESNTVTLQLNWLPDAQHGGYYAALLNGHYARRGLDVEILAGGPGRPVIPKVALGRVDFAIANADQVLMAAAQDAQIIAVMAALQDSPRCIMVHEDAGIASFDDLHDLTLAMGEGKVIRPIPYAQSAFA